eukprot:12938797-Alexandrium_andersonii.AAC.1
MSTQRMSSRSLSLWPAWCSNVGGAPSSGSGAGSPPFRGLSSQTSLPPIGSRANPARLTSCPLLKSPATKS